MTKTIIRTHPEVLFAYSSDPIDMIIRIENPSTKTLWAEAEVTIPENLSLVPNSELRRGRIRMGIVERNEYLEKSLRVYGTRMSNPQIYPCKVIIYIFNKDGIIESRLEKTHLLRCEMKRDERI